ncbi:MAG: hypothetical protein WBC05_20100 [Sedimentisphaerales bacterium]
MSKKLMFLALLLVFGLMSSAHAATIIWVSGAYDDNGDGEPDDQEWIDLLEAEGYTVDLSFRNQESNTLDDDKIAVMEAADLIIISRNSNSGDFANDATEIAQWNSITTPILNCSTHTIRSSRLLWLNTTSLASLSGSAISITAPAHPIFAGIPDQSVILDDPVGPSSFPSILDVGNGTLLAQVDGTDAAWIAEWETGVEFYSGAGQFAGGQRMLFCVGTQEGGTVGRGEMNLTPDGLKLFFNAVRYMLGGAIEQAHGPDPADGALVEDTWASLNFSPGDFAASHDIYMGENFDDVNDATQDSELFRGNSSSTFFIVGFPGNPYPEGLVPGTTYYWRIDEVNEADPNSPWKGNVWSFSIPPKTAYNPDPADDAESMPANATLSWTAGFDAKVHYIVFGEDFDEVSDAAQGVPNGNTSYNPGLLKLAKTYYWRVDEFDGAGTHKGDVWSFTTEGAVGGPKPANGAEGVSATSIITWNAGAIAASHEVYFGIDADAVKNATNASPEYKGPKALGDESYDPGELMLGTTYYWRIEEVNGVNPDSPWAGNVWSFTTGDFFVLDDFETYDANENQIWYAWHDGLGYGMQGIPPFFAGNGTGAAVGDETTASFTEETIVNGGLQSMPLSYDNNKQGYSKYSEAEFTLSNVRDWTAEGVAELSLWFRGNPASVGSFIEGPTGTYTMTAGGADIWNDADEFHFAYKVLTGVGTIKAQVLSVDDTDPWAKAGVMIRETLDAGSKFAAAYITPGNGCRYQARVDTDVAATSDTSVATAEQIAITAPYWIQIERDFAGNFRCSYSANGSTWQQMSWGAQNISMSSNVYVGLAVTSHNTDETCQVKFSNVTITGTVTQQWASQDVGIASNAAEPLYVAVSNSAGAPAVVIHDDPSAANINTWTEWVIPLQAFADQGINLSNVDRIAIGLGTQGNMTIPGGSGKMFIDDIRLYRPRVAAE